MFRWSTDSNTSVAAEGEEYHYNGKWDALSDLIT